VESRDRRINLRGVIGISLPLKEVVFYRRGNRDSDGKS
jgi:hypothetical protein